VDVVSRVGAAATSAPLRVILKEDWETGFRSWGRPGLHALVLYRVARWATARQHPLRLPLLFVCRVLNVALIRNVYGMEISHQAVIGRRVLIGHHQAVQIPAYCIIGDDTVVRHNVNIGFGGGDPDPLAVPHIGRNVQLGSGCCIIGPIRVGHGAKIGPNCVVISNVPDGATLMAPAPRVFKAAAGAPMGPESAADQPRTP